MKLKEYIQYIKLRFKADIEIDLKLWKKFGGVVFECNGMLFRDDCRIIKNAKDVDKVVELIKDHEKTGSSVFRVIDKTFICDWNDYKIYDTSDVEVEFFDTGWLCRSVSNKSMLVKNNKIQGIFKYNKFFTAPEDEGMHFDKILSTYSFKEASDEKMEEKYPGLMRVFKSGENKKEIYKDGLNCFNK